MQIYNGLWLYDFSLPIYTLCNKPSTMNRSEPMCIVNQTFIVSPFIDKNVILLVLNVHYLAPGIGGAIPIPGGPAEAALGPNKICKWEMKTQNRKW